jgi:diguanylate cyclase (GGDEF)-like protein
MSREPTDPTPGEEVPPLREELTGAVYALLNTHHAGHDRLVAEVEDLAEREGTGVFAELFYLLAHIRFKDDEAERHWTSVMQLRGVMAKALGYKIDLSVALVNYFVQVNRRLKNPKLIELRVFEETRASAFVDDLTGLHNFRFFQKYLGWEVTRRERHGGSFSIVMGDIDNFKSYNDRFGHDQGNHTLLSVARTLVEASREEDVVARYGGEEFVIIMPETTKDAAAQVADRVRAAVEDLKLSDDDPLHRVTISLGVANYPGDATSPEDLLRCADRAMYTAKARGKNQVQLYGANRRAYRRVASTIEGEYRGFEAEVRPFSTLDISERSLRVAVGHEMPEDSLVEFSLTLPEHDEKVRALGRVVRSEEVEGGGYHVVLMIVDIAGDAHLILKQYLRRESGEATD